MIPIEDRKRISITKKLSQYGVSFDENSDINDLEIILNKHELTNKVNPTLF